MCTQNVKMMTNLLRLLLAGDAEAAAAAHQEGDERHARGDGDSLGDSYADICVPRRAGRQAKGKQ